ncbi:hypothetical protein LA080_006238 [Diaporthe eres]|nr:hypothetical protein LA080_006238 [Diaporthe eres]
MDSGESISQPMTIENERDIQSNTQHMQVFTGTANRYGHTCHIAGNRQMITVGGIESSNVTGKCDWETMGVAVLDLTLMGWGSVFDSNAAPYQVNTMISDVIGGGPNGNATMLLPDGGWISTGLAKLFTGTTNQTEPYSPPGSLPVTSGSDSTRATKAGAIVGGVIGGVLLLALLGLLAWRIRRKRFRRLDSAKDANGQTGVDKPELQSTPAISGAMPAALTREASGMTSEIAGTPVGELSGPIPELEGH